MDATASVHAVAIHGRKSEHCAATFASVGRILVSQPRLEQNHCIRPKQQFPQGIQTTTRINTGEGMSDEGLRLATAVDRRRAQSIGPLCDIACACHSRGRAQMEIEERGRVRISVSDASYSAVVSVDARNQNSHQGKRNVVLRVRLFGMCRFYAPCGV